MGFIWYRTLVWGPWNFQNDFCCGFQLSYRQVPQCRCCFYQAWRSCATLRQSVTVLYGIYIYSPIIDYYSPNPYEFTREYMICGHVWVNNPRCNLVLHVAMIRKIIHLERLDGNHVFVPTTNQEHDNSMVISWSTYRHEWTNCWCQHKRSLVIYGYPWLSWGPHPVDCMYIYMGKL